MENQEAVDLVRNLKDPQEAAKRLTDEAVARNSKDDISCIVVHFRWFHSGKSAKAEEYDDHPKHTTSFPTPSHPCHAVREFGSIKVCASRSSMFPDFMLILCKRGNGGFWWNLGQRWYFLQIEWTILSECFLPCTTWTIQRSFDEGGMARRGQGLELCKHLRCFTAPQYYTNWNTEWQDGFSWSHWWRHWLVCIPPL